MKKTNKLAALLMATALVLAVTACDSSPASSSSSAPDESSSSSSSVPESSSSAVLTAPDKEYVKGVTTGNEYVSEFWGIKFTSPSENIMLATPEQLAELLGFGADALGTDPKLLEEMKTQMDAYELAAIDMTSGSMVMIMSTEMPLSGISAEIYMQGVLEGVKATGSNVVIELDNEGKTVKETIGGKEFTTASYTMKGTEGVPDNHQTQRVLVDGKRVLLITSTCPPALETAKAAEAALIGAITAIE